MLSKTKKAKTVQRVTGDASTMPEWITSLQAAQLCHVSLNTFRRHIMSQVTTKRLGWRLQHEKASVLRYYRSLDDPSRHPRRGRQWKKEAARG